jgi:hypothetical protein
MHGARDGRDGAAWARADRANLFAALVAAGFAVALLNPARERIG